ncbi:Pr6Pr family membrane protein [Compostibacter hankyongensis]|uniref:Pr6Pr family membrane protein n=1 Tax=Compostibacter hankyongensis TaxID=1007089 RepID=A0ABP8FW09_9BACT
MGQTRSGIIHFVLLIAFAAAIVVAIDPFHPFSSPDPNFRGLNLFSFFTVQSNLIAAATLLAEAWMLVTGRRPGPGFGMLRGAAVLYMLLTALVYALLLQGVVDANSALAFNWKNFILHQLAPLFVLVEWLLWPPALSVSSGRSLTWLIFPILWLVYTLTRAALTGWYPYPFLNPSWAGGTKGVIIYVVCITIGLVLMCLILAWVSRERNRGNKAGPRYV